MALIAAYTNLSGTAESADDLETLEQMQSSIDTLGGWQPELQVEAIISQLALPADSLLSELSGGLAAARGTGEGLGQQTRPAAAG